MRTAQEQMEWMTRGFGKVISDAIGYGRRMHKSVNDVAADAATECALWVRENVTTVDYDRIKMMIKKLRSPFPNTVIGSTEEVALAKALSERKWRYVTHWTESADDNPEGEDPDSRPLADIDEANVVTSENWYYEEIREKNPNYDHVHLPVLDLDCRHTYIPSTTPGHGHLLLDVALNQEQFENLLNVLAECGILDYGYAKASLTRGYSAVRLPWIRKEVSLSDPWADLEEKDNEPTIEIPISDPVGRENVAGAI